MGGGSPGFVKPSVHTLDEFCALEARLLQNTLGRQIQWVRKPSYARQAVLFHRGYEGKSNKFSRKAVAPGDAVKIVSDFRSPAGIKRVIVQTAPTNDVETHGISNDPRGVAKLSPLFFVCFESVSARG